MRRLLLVLTVALVMAAMVVVTAAPAFADKGEGGHLFDCSEVLCGSAGGGGTGGEGATFTITTPPSDPADPFLPNITSIGGSGAKVCNPGSNTTCVGPLS